MANPTVPGRGSSGTVSSSIGYTGGWTDPNTGLVYLRARDYDPASGQFLTRDPAIDTTHQPYAYVNNDPASVTDPTGLCGSTPTPWVHCAEPDLFDQIMLSGPAIALGNALTQGPTGEASNFLQGIGNGATFGLTGMLRDALVPTYACQADNDPFFTAGTIGGGVALGVVTAGGSTELEGAAAAAEGSARFVANSSGEIVDNVGSRNAVSLGHYPEYVDHASRTGARTFSLPDEDWNGMSAVEKQARNQGFLDDAIRKGSRIDLATPAAQARPGSGYEWELGYLRWKGYSVTNDGMSMER